jgi:hypothetical protein
LHIQDGQTVQVELGEVTAVMAARLLEGVPPGVALVPRSLGLPLKEPSPIHVRALEVTV